jgi:hypothetical protein
MNLYSHISKDVIILEKNPYVELGVIKFTLDLISDFEDYEGFTYNFKWYKENQIDNKVNFNIYYKFAKKIWDDIPSILEFDMKHLLDFSKYLNSFNSTNVNTTKKKIAKIFGERAIIACMRIISTKERSIKKEDIIEEVEKYTPNTEIIDTYDLIWIIRDFTAIYSNFSDPDVQDFIKSNTFEPKVKEKDQDLNYSESRLSAFLRAYMLVNSQLLTVIQRTFIVESMNNYMLDYIAYSEYFGSNISNADDKYFIDSYKLNRILNYDTNKEFTYTTIWANLCNLTLPISYKIDKELIKKDIKCELPNNICFRKSIAKIELAIMKRYNLNKLDKSQFGLYSTYILGILFQYHYILCKDNIVKVISTIWDNDFDYVDCYDRNETILMITDIF